MGSSKTGVAILERLDAQERLKIGQQASYHEAKAEIARIAQQLKSNNADAAPRRDVAKAARQIVECIASLDNVESMSAESQKALFGRFVD